jgi:acyl-CoA synthetase (AMP-forming)/AMP-acid ligase II
MTGLTPTPSSDTLERRFSDFETLGDALDYAAQGQRGLNFHDMRGQLARCYPFSEMRKDALDAAYRLISHGVKKEDRIAVIAETGPEFAALFFGCVYAGAWPVPLPLPTSFGGKESYIDQIMVQLKSCDPSILFFPPELAEMAGEAAKRCNVEGIDWAEFNDRIALKTNLPPAKTDEICYLQYSSGSTRFPHGVAVSHHALRAGNRSKAINFLWITLALGFAFVGVQAYEYIHAYRDLNLKLSSGIFGSTFFLLTGFHGFHVLVGMLMLLFITLRLQKGHFTPERHFGFEGAAWYWHFVDVVWLGLYFLVYWL